MIPGVIARSRFADGNTLALLHLDGTNGSTTITDVRGNTWTVFDNAQLSTARKVFGTASLLLDGTNDYIRSASAGINLNTIDFTVEGRAYFDQAAFTGSANGWALWSNWLNSAGSRMLLRVLANGRLEYNQQGPAASPSNSITAAANAIPFQTWFHWAITRSGSTVTLWLDGTSVATGSLATRTDFPLGQQIGVFDPTSGGGFKLYWPGSFDEVRISKVARYSSNFTPSASAFPA